MRNDHKKWWKITIKKYLPENDNQEMITKKYNEKWQPKCDYQIFSKTYQTKHDYQKITEMTTENDHKNDNQKKTKKKTIKRNNCPTMKIKKWTTKIKQSRNGIQKMTNKK